MHLRSALLVATAPVLAPAFIGGSLGGGARHSQEISGGGAVTYRFQHEGTLP